jgi:hypothetical protein
MPKMLEPAELTALIIKLKDEKALKWPEVVGELSRMGVVSRRTREPFASSTLRSIYKYTKMGGAPARDLEDRLGPGGMDLVLEKVRAFLEVDVDDKTKLKLIRGALDKVDY